MIFRCACKMEFRNELELTSHLDHYKKAREASGKVYISPPKHRPARGRIQAAVDRQNKIRRLRFINGE